MFTSASDDWPASFAYDRPRPSSELSRLSRCADLYRSSYCMPAFGALSLQKATAQARTRTDVRGLRISGWTHPDFSSTSLCAVRDIAHVASPDSPPFHARPPTPNLQWAHSQSAHRPEPPIVALGHLGRLDISRPKDSPRLSYLRATSEPGAYLDPHAGGSGTASLPRTGNTIPIRGSPYVLGILTCLTGEETIPGFPASQLGIE